MGSNKSIVHLCIPFMNKVLFGRKFSAAIDVTDRCNLHCTHCFHRETAATEDVSLAEWGKRFKQYYNDGIRYVCFIGGEPTLRFDVVELAEEYFPAIAVFTNGQKKIPATFNRRIHLSLDGLEDVHDRIRGAGTFVRAVNNYRNDARVVVMCILSKLNYLSKENLIAFIEYIRTMGVHGLHIDFFIPQVDIPSDTDLMLNNEEYAEVGEVLIKELRRDDSILFATEDLIRCQVNNAFHSHTCVFKKDIFVYGVDGKLKYCGSETNDCTQCRVWERYSVPFYQFRNWWQFKKTRLDESFHMFSLGRRKTHKTVYIPKMITDNQLDITLQNV